VTVVTGLGLKGVYTVRHYDHLLLEQGTQVFHKMFWWFYHKWCLLCRVRSLQSWCVHPCLTADSPAVNKTQSRLVPVHQTLHLLIFAYVHKWRSLCIRKLAQMRLTLTVHHGWCCPYMEK